MLASFFDLVALILTTSGIGALAAPSSILVPRFDPAKWDNPYQGTPANHFAGDASLPVKRLAVAALKGQHQQAAFVLNAETSVKSVVFNDWANFPDVSAYFFTADMDVDCDGKDYRCPGNQDGDPHTSYGALAAYAVPWIVIPEHFTAKHQDQLPGNNIAAVICNGALYYGILGDTNGNDPQVIGEASWVIARTCFPNDDLNGNKGHGAADVTYIVFNNEVFPYVDGTYITNYAQLRSMGNDLMTRLTNNLGI